MKFKKIIAVLGIVGLIAGCDFRSFKDAPLTLTWRNGMLSDFVMQISNLSAQEGVEVYLYVASSNNSARSGNFVLPANATKEIGALEFNWKFKTGDKGFVCPVKYNRRLFFEVLSNNSYRTWFGFNDIPEVDVASQVRAQRLERLYGEGKKLYGAITNANIRQVALGKSTLWPKAQGTLKERAKENLLELKAKIEAKLKDGDATIDVKKNISTLKFKSSNEYFMYLFDVDRFNSNNHTPLISTNILSCVIENNFGSPLRGFLPPNMVKWSVLADYNDDLSENIPILISSNFPCERLRSFWDGREAADEIIPLADVEPLKNETMVVVYKDGKGKRFLSTDVKLSNIYLGAFNTCTNGYNRPLRYLTPYGVVNAVGMERQ
jgi:hypothetical protein